MLRVLIVALVPALLAACAEHRSADPLGPDGRGGSSVEHQRLATPRVEVALEARWTVAPDEREAVDPDRAAPLHLVLVDERTRAPLAHRSARIEPLGEGAPARGVFTGGDGRATTPALPFGRVRVSIGPDAFVDVDHARGAGEAVVALLPPLRPHSVELLGAAPAQADRWTLCFVSSVAGSLAARQSVAHGTGAAADFHLGVAQRRRVVRGGTWVVLGRDGLVFGTLAQPPGPAERLDLHVAVRATGAIAVAFRAPDDAGPPAPLRLDDRGNRWPVSGAEVLFRPLAEITGEPWIDERLAAGRWLPAGAYEAELRSVHLEPWSESVGLVAGERVVVPVPCRERRGVTTVRLSITAAPGTDGLPTLFLTSRSGATVRLEPRALDSMLWAGSKHFSAYTRVGEGIGLVEIERAEPEELSWRATQPGTLTERGRSHAADAVHIELEWRAAPPTPSYEIDPNDRFEPGGSPMTNAADGDASHGPR